MRESFFGYLVDEWNEISFEGRNKIIHDKYFDGDSVALKMPASNYSEEGGEFTITFVGKEEAEGYPESFVFKSDVSPEDYPEVVKGEFIRNIDEVEVLLRDPKCVGSARAKEFFGIKFEDKMTGPAL